MATYQSTSTSTSTVIVRNLPTIWTKDQLVNYLEENSKGYIWIGEIRPFLGVSHCVLLLLEQHATEEMVSEVQEELHSCPFEGKHTLEVEAISDTTCAVLVPVSDPEVTRDHLLHYFKKFGSGDAEVLHCETCLEFGFAVVYFSSPEAAKEVTDQPNHEILEGEAVQVEPWYEPFHRTLLQQRILSPTPFRFDQTPTEGTASAKDKTPQEQELQALASENKRLANEVKQLRNRKETRVAVQLYQWQLLQNSDLHSVGCDMKFLKQEEVVVFSGTEEECQEAQLQLLKLKQNLREEVVPVAQPITELLLTRGRSRFEESVQRHPKCSAKIDHLCITCAALTEEDLEGPKQDFQNAFSSATVEISQSLTSSPLFQTFKAKLERDLLVTVILPGEGSETMDLHGFTDDVDQAVTEVGQFVSVNQKHGETFRVPGRLEGEAFRKWYSQELDQIKELIFKSGGDAEESMENGYTLDYQCSTGVLREVKSKLDDMKRKIASDTISLDKEFSDESEKSLVINGLWDMGRQLLCSQVEQKLSQKGVKGVADITLPDRRRLSPFRRDRHVKNQNQTPAHTRSARQAQSSLLSGRRFHSDLELSRATEPSLPHSVTVRKTTITLKMGDIATEQVEAAVCPVASDMNLAGTAVGSAFLRKYPSLKYAPRDANAVEAVGTKGCGIKLTWTKERQSAIFLAILTRLPKDEVTQTVKDMVLRILSISEENGITSIAFPPVGVGRRFKFGGFTTASAMMCAIQTFLAHKKPKHLRTINIVVYREEQLAAKFTDALSQTLHDDSTQRGKEVLRTVRLVGRTVGRTVGRAIARGAVALSRKVQEKVRAVRAGRPDAAEQGDQNTGRFEATVCVSRHGDLKKLKEMLIEELRVTFLWQETVRDHKADGFHTLPTHLLHEIAQAAVQNNVLLSAPGRAVELKGQKHKVQEVLLLISDKSQDEGVCRGNLGQSKRQDLGLPVDTGHLPSYWRVRRWTPGITYDKAIESWKKRGTRLNPVSAETQAAVEKLVHSTWDKTVVGRGADAVNLGHSEIQVIKVERLENPWLWKKYSHSREHILDTLAHHSTRRRPVACKTLETIPASKGPVRTSQFIDAKGPLNRDVYRQANEHYLFHGTRQEALSKIYNQGLDFRVTTRAMLGKGVYSAESSTKADQYADKRESRAPPGTPLTMMLIRVLLGEPYLYTDPDPKEFDRPPCLRCQGRPKECGCRESRLHDSVVFDANGKLFREFVVYDRDVCYPEYIITYIRK
ncbi:uncharacterized protein LOC143283790 isoform X2 [Babylonia areolata]|uniref:uncharacterized protein LOC143283790 isoform X2 n=1 Tax=Babylonia areolata TaxID=304850 RepID=UPI003FD18668